MYLHSPSRGAAGGGGYNGIENDVMPASAAIDRANFNAAKWTVDRSVSLSPPPTVALRYI